MGKIKYFILFLIMVLFLTVTGETKPKKKKDYYTMTVHATAYSYTGSVTSTGISPYRGVVAVDPAVIPYGTKMYIPGYGHGVAADCGGAIVGNRIDLFMDTVDECYEWGFKKVTIKIYY